LLIGLLVGGVLAISFAISAWAGLRRTRDREREERRAQWDEKLGITNGDVATSSGETTSGEEATSREEEVEEGDTADLGEAVASESGTALGEETAGEAAADDEVAEPTPVDATRPPHDRGP
jgi:hypothetical protein